MPDHNGYHDWLDQSHNQNPVAVTIAQCAHDLSPKMVARWSYYCVYRFAALQPVHLLQRQKINAITQFQPDLADDEPELKLHDFANAVDRPDNAPAALAVPDCLLQPAPFE